MRRFDLAIFIGRFQPFHLGHLATVQKALNKANNLIILVGSYKRPRSPKNPWTFEERKAMIELCLPDSEKDRVRILPIRDYLYSDTMWMNNIYNTVSPHIRKNDKITIMGYKKDDSSYYLSMFPNWINEDNQCDQEFVHGLNATDIRERMFPRINLKLQLVSWKEKIHPNLIQEMEAWLKTDHGKWVQAYYDNIRAYKEQWSKSPYTPIFTTTDAIVISSGHVLMIKRKNHPGEDLWALPGGFLNEKEKIIDGIIRELKEETSIGFSKQDLRSLMHPEVRVFDHPERDLRGRFITHTGVFNVPLIEGRFVHTKGADDAKKTKWFRLDELEENSDLIYADHFDIIMNRIGVS